MRRTSIRGAGTVMVCAILAGCSAPVADSTSSVDEVAATEPADGPSAAPVGGTTSAVIDLDGIGGAGEDDLDWLMRDLPNGPGTFSMAVALTPRGIVGLRASWTELGLPELATGSLGWWDGQAFSPIGTGYASLPEADRQIGGAAASESHVVWVEAASMDLALYPWRVFSWDATTGEVALLARSEDVFGDNVPFAAVNDPVPVIYGERAYWHSAYVRPDGSLRTEVLSVPLSGGDLRVEQDLAALPMLTDRGVVTARMRDVSVSELDPIQDPRAVAAFSVLNEDGATDLITLDEGTEVSSSAGAGDWIAYVAGGNIHVVSLSGRDGYTVPADDGAGGHAAGLCLTEERLSWVYAGEMSITDAIYTLDLTDGDALTIAASNNSILWCAGDQILWYSVTEGLRGAMDPGGNLYSLVEVR